MSAQHTPMFQPRVRAVLGPTNTGKTHLAITRLLAHASGIIGFPLRLLARENYDRMVAAKGEKHVALITGEEKIVPPDARWFACTVEAMPLDRRVEFLAVDEIQLCADPDRGHVFTDRLLNARGMVETMFLGAETIRPLLTRLVPGVEVETRPRLSQLSYAGPAKLTRLPPRSAVVAFSGAEVYAIAEAIRRRRGGCAVVMGRLSPRTRNAQVALYQNREVDFLVATDAIGMGLNMDVDHVAFASLQKFDGHRPRPLTSQEAAQIAGRAGRGMRDGSFGTTAECPPLDDDMVEKIETHSFEALSALAWRNAALDFASPDALLDSLAASPPTPGLAKGNDATDHITLSALARDVDVRRLADRPARVRLLWEACQIPDFRKLADDSHTRFCARVFGHVVNDGRLPADWIASGIAACGSTEGDLDTLMSRLSSIRIWAYVAARADWLDDAVRFQNEARAVEDTVSDALHESLTARFVDRRAAHLIRKLDEPEEELLSAVTRRGEVVVEGHPVGTISGFAFEPAEGTQGEEEKKLILRAARRALREEMPRRVTLLEAAADDAFALTPLQRITWTAPGADAADVARIKPGPTPDKPLVEALPSEFLDGAERERVRARIAAWLEALMAKEFAPIAEVEKKAAEDADLRGPAFRMREMLGLDPAPASREMPQEQRAKLKAIGIRAGRFATYLPEMLKPRTMALRAQLWALKAGMAVPPLPGSGLVSTTPPAGWPRGFGAAIGWVPAGPVVVRLDVAERVAGEVGHLARRGAAMLPGEIASRLGVKADQLAAALGALGFRLLPAMPLDAAQYGPPAPAMVEIRRHERPQRPERGPRPAGRAPEPRAVAAPPAEAPAFIPPAIAAAMATPAEQGAERPRRQDRRPQREPAGGMPQRRPEARGDRPPRDGRPRGSERPQGGERPGGPLRPRSEERPPAEERAPAAEPARADDRQRRQPGPEAPRGDRPRPPGPDRGPRRDRGDRPERSWRDPAPSKGSDPDSPFAVLAALLKK
jgi:ATP-dependent RNA helicase SUPV3L1/SUV3